MNLVPLPESKIENLKPLITTMFSEGDLSEFTSEKNFIEAIKRGYQVQGLDAYVDSLDTPTTLIVLLVFYSAWYDNVVLSVMSRYTAPDKRGSKADVIAGNKLINAYAKVKGAGLIMAGSRTAYLDGAAERMLEKDGFKHVESTHVKIV